MTEKKYKPLSLRYPGGKARAAKKIIAQMPHHEVYVEPFSGAAHVFLRKPPAKINILNDKNQEIIDFFRQVSGRKLCCRMDGGKERFLRLRHKQGKSACDFLFVNKASYGGMNATYGYTREGEKGGEVCVDGSKLNKARLRNQDFRKIIKKYDSKNTLFYVDPPYVKANQGECLYHKGFCQVTPKEVADSLHGIKGKAIVSYDNHPEVRKAFQGFKTSTITLPYSFAKKDGKIKGKTKELLIKNF